MINRRCFLASAAATSLGAPGSRAGSLRAAALSTRGVVLVPEDLTLADWPERARHAGLTTIGIHHQNSPRAVIDWIGTDAGQGFLGACRRLGLMVEYELHAMKELLPRDLFKKAPELFRLDEKGHRNSDANACPHSDQGLEIIAENAVRIATALRPTTGRYFLWGDDGHPWCACSRCKGLSPSEQALLVENRIIQALRGIDPEARLAHLSYTNTLTPPRQVKPAPGIFLEYAPIRRRYDAPYATQSAPGQPDPLSALEENLKVFPVETAQVLEYWLDVSRFSSWKRPAVRLPWRRDVLEADITAYSSRGIRHVTSFAVYVDADYRRRYGEPTFLDEYGEVLSRSARGR